MKNTNPKRKLTMKNMAAADFSLLIVQLVAVNTKKISDRASVVVSVKDVADGIFSLN
jgi:hypothetical protein